MQEARIEQFEDLITLVSAAKSRQVKYHTLYRWAKRKDLPTYRVGRTILVRKEDVARYQFGARD